RVPARVDRHQVGVPTLDERGGPGPVDMPEHDPHDRPSTSRSTAATRSVAEIEVRQGCPGTGQVAARLSRQVARGSARRTCGTRYGPHCPKRTVGAKRLTTGVPTD